MSLRLDEWLQDASQRLKSAANQPRSEARRLLEKFAKIAVVDQISDPQTVLQPSQVEALSLALERRVSGEPLSRITGEREFWGLLLDVDGATLDPRADSETLIEQILELLMDHTPQSILDIGTGSGALLLALLHEFPSAKGLGVDQSESTLTVARRNAARLGLEDKSEFLNSDWLSAVTGTFDLIISNPPYIPTDDLAGLDKNVRDFDDPLALDGGADGLDFYQRTLTQAQAYLRPGGLLVLELGIDQSDAVLALAMDHGWECRGLKSDLGSVPRSLALTRAGEVPFFLGNANRKV